MPKVNERLLFIGYEPDRVKELTERLGEDAYSITVVPDGQAGMEAITASRPMSV